MAEETKRGRGRPRLSEEEKKERKELRELGYDVPGTRPDRQIQVEPGDNARYLTHAMMIRNMSPVNKNDAKAVEDRITWYLNHCIDFDMKPTVKGFCNALGVARQTLLNWRTGAYRAGTHEEIIVRAYDLLEEMWENYMMNGKVNPMAGLFLGCNNFGYKDVKQLNVTPVVNNEPETIDAATIEAKYAELPED